jgi:hypothetical protein
MSTQNLEKLPLLPESLRTYAKFDRRILRAEFDDTAAYHPALIKTILAKERHVRAGHKPNCGACGSKIYNIEQWDCPAARFLNQRINALIKHVCDMPHVLVDLSWASVYRKHDYCMPHSHVRSKLGVVYMLDEGEPGDRQKDPIGGRLCFVDPRIASSCPEGEGLMTRPFVPNMRPGSVVVFPSGFVHCVPPYTGQKTRITLSWDITDKIMPGSSINTIQGRLNPTANQC